MWKTCGQRGKCGSGTLPLAVQSFLVSCVPCSERALDDRRESAAGRESEGTEAEDAGCALFGWAGVGGLLKAGGSPRGD